ncbi:MAG: hypothetical protein EBT33_20335 [Betaproteobacteria bacterium]|nr:hypothetical protein [Betaproteobacteria bacterium]
MARLPDASGVQQHQAGDRGAGEGGRGVSGLSRRNGQDRRRLAVGVYEALKTGNLDYSFINPGNIQSLKLNEVAKNHCGPVMAISGHNITISKRTWARLPADIQKIFLEEGKATQQAYMNWVTDFESKAVANMRAQGANVVPISAPELAKWRAAAPDFLAEWEKATAAATGDAETPRKVAARWRELIGK